LNLSSVEVSVRGVKPKTSNDHVAAHMSPLSCQNLEDDVS
jgi:hypothetical protein